MTIPVFFRWKKPIDGYEAVNGYVQDLRPTDDSGTLEEVIVTHLLLKSNSNKKIEAPANDPGLFKTFAETSQTPKGIIEFANKYGQLGMARVNAFPTERSAVEAFPYTEGEPDQFMGERISDWVSNISSMKSMINLWEHTDEIAKKYVRWEGYEKVFFDLPDNKILIARQGHPVFGELRPGDHLGPGMVYLLDTINFYIRNVHPVFTLIDERPQTTLQPTTLLNAMWLHFSIAVSEDKNFRSCKHCGKYFEIGPRKGRKSKQYCSDSCRVMASRLRKEQGE